MTLIVSEVSRFGIAMAADSAVTDTYPTNWQLTSGAAVPPTVRIGAQKIHPIHSVGGAISAWGIASVGMPTDKNANIPVDSFLPDFIGLIKPNETFDDIGRRLAEEVNKRIVVGEVEGGFHLAGYAQEGGKRYPILYHIHTGHSGDSHKAFQLYRDYPFDSGFSIDQWLEALSKGAFAWLRNGNFDEYAYFSKSLNELMNTLKEKTGFICPDYEQFTTPLEARGRFLKLQLQTICEFYRHSNRLETIAMPISWLTISHDGSIEDFEPIKL